MKNNAYAQSKGTGATGAGHKQHIPGLLGIVSNASLLRSEQLSSDAITGLEPSVRVVEGGEHSFDKTWADSTEWWIQQWKDWLKNSG